MLENKNINEPQNPVILVGDVIGSACPFEIGEIVVFESWFRFEIYISRVMQIHIDYWGNGCAPTMTKATLEQKQQWYDNGEYEMVIGSACPRHKPKQLGYLQWHDWVEQKTKRGAKQKQCPKCGRWYFREEF
jgi:hypothetical protein